MRRRAVALSNALLRLAAIPLTAAGIVAASLHEGCAQESVRESARENAKERSPAGPLVIARQGWFFAGGAIDAGRPGAPTVGHMYVEFQIPQNAAHPYPVVMIHGGSQTGTNFTGTPDGRDGWAQYFLRRGYAVYIVDQVARGRAAQWSQANGPVTAANLARLEQRFVAPERFNLWPQGAPAQPVAGERQAGRPELRPVLCQPVSLARRFSAATGAQSRRWRRAARPHRPRCSAGSFPVGRICVADRRQATQPRQGNRRRRAQRPARP